MAERNYPLPDYAVYAKPGAYIVRNKLGQYQVFKVGHLHVISPLLPVESASGSGVVYGFIDARDVGGSNPPELFYLVEVFSRMFETSESAVAAIDANSLGESLPNQYISVSNFRKEHCTVHSR